MEENESTDTEEASENAKVSVSGDFADHAEAILRHSHWYDPVNTLIHTCPSESKHRDGDTHGRDWRWVQSNLGIRDDTVIRVKNGFEIFVNVDAKDTSSE